MTVRRLALTAMTLAGGVAIDGDRSVAQTPVSSISGSSFSDSSFSAGPATHGGLIDASLDRWLMADDPVQISADQLGWSAEVHDPIGYAAAAHGVTLEQMIETAMESSPHIAAILTRPRAAQREIVIADAAFDTTTFLDSNLADTSDPIGSVLTTGILGGRYRDTTFGGGGGLRKRNRYGGSVELAQRGVWQRNNSTFLSPNPQSNTRLDLNFTQPLMRDAGRGVNRFRVVLARLESVADTHQARADIESHLIQIAAAYWALYRERSNWILQRRSLDQSAAWVDTLRRREGFDVTRRQVIKAESSLATHQAAVTESLTAVRDAETRLRTLIASPHIDPVMPPEWCPTDVPRISPAEANRRDASIAAIQYRADIAAAMVEIRKASERLGVAKNGLRPRLDLLLSGYVSGLNSRSNWSQSLGSQFFDGRPSVAGGVAFEMPRGNRAARARLAREQLGVNKAIFEFESTTQRALGEVEIAARSVDATAAQIAARQSSVDAATRELDYLKRRFETLPDPDESATLLIEDMLDALDLWLAQRRALVAAETAHAMSHLKLRRSMGLLVQMHPTCDGPFSSVDLPSTPSQDFDASTDTNFQPPQLGDLLSQGLIDEESTSPQTSRIQ